MESDSPIPAPAKGLANILKRGQAGIQAELMGAPAIHRQFMSGQVSSEQILASEEIEQRVTGQAPVIEALGRGDDVVDLERKRKGTIIRVLKASEDGQKRYEVVDSRGNAWKQKAKQLRKR